MNKPVKLFLLTSLLLVVVQSADARTYPKLTDEQSAATAKNYQQYCALCHGADRQGHVNDHAPSLRSKSLLETGVQERRMVIGYGRPGTPMAGFFDELGGPLSKADIYQMAVWLQEQIGTQEKNLSMGTVEGDVSLGKALYARECTECHGAKGEGVTGTALGNQAMLSMTRDKFIRHAIENGRQGTEMPAFGEKLSPEELDGLTAFIRSRATGWEVRIPVLRRPPRVEDYILNPEGDSPEFTLKDDRYIMSKDLYEAMQSKKRMVLLDTRAMSLWQMANVEGSVPMPYYYVDVSDLAQDLPRDGTWIVTYCECPRAAAEHVNQKLVKLGFTNTAVLWEGAYGWISLGYPVTPGDTTPADTSALQME